MSNPMQSIWKGLAPLKPGLRSHVVVNRHDYRGEIYYVLEDKITGRHHRFNSDAYFFIGFMNGQHSMEDIWQKAQQHMQDKCPPQTEFIRLIGALNTADMLDTQTLPDLDKLFERQQQKKKQDWKRRFGNPLSLRFPLTDPDTFLDRYYPWLQFCLTRIGWWLLVITLLSAGLLLIVHWTDVAAHASTKLLTPSNMILMWLTYPFVKLLHELGHAFAVKHGGGEVHEMGIMLLIFTPIPYVDASSASAFRDKQQRIMVGAAGIGVELFIASWALFLWLATDSGFFNNLAFCIMVLSGVSTILFNGNPLLRYDGYYVLADAIGIPNLASRAKNYFGHLVQHYIYKLELPDHRATAGEKAWFIFYAIASWFYCMGLLIFIITYLIQSFFIVGLILALWAMGFQLVLPTIKYLHFIATSPQIQPRRQRSLTILASASSFILIFTLVVPIPFSTNTQGVISLPENTQLRAKTNGFVHRVKITSNQTVVQGNIIIELEDLKLQTQAAIMDARHRELKAELSAYWSSDRVRTEITREKIRALETERRLIDKELNALTITSPASGQAILPQGQDLIGKFIRKGTLLGYIANGSQLQVRTVFSQEDAALLKQIKGVTARVAGQTHHLLKAHLKRIVPEANQQLPSPTLSELGGGKILTEPNDSSVMLARKKYFHVELSLPLPSQQVLIGQRVYLKFDHGTAPLAAQGYRVLRQFFLEQIKS